MSEEPRIRYVTIVGEQYANVSDTIAALIANGFTDAAVLLKESAEGPALNSYRVKIR